MSPIEKVSGKYSPVCDAVVMFDKVVIGFSEFVATFILVFVACMGCVPNREHEVVLQQSALVSGLAVMIVIFIFGHISGAHVNPLTTVCAVIVGQTPLSLAPIYFMGEMLGAVAGYGLLMVVTPDVYTSVQNDAHGICMTLPSKEISTVQALFVEVLLSLILSFANCSSWDYRNERKADSVPLKFGFLVAALIMAGGPYTGASMNPAKSFAPALWNNDWEEHWVYWVGPLAAALLAATCYRFFFLKGKSVLNEPVPQTTNAFFDGAEKGL